MHMIALLPFIAEAHPADKPMTQSCCSLLAVGEDLVPEVGLPKKRVVDLKRHKRVRRLINAFFSMSTCCKAPDFPADLLGALLRAQDNLQSRVQAGYDQSSQAGPSCHQRI